MHNDQIAMTLNLFPFRQFFTSGSIVDLARGERSTSSFEATLAA
jgi:hypothetical protein